MKFNSKLAVVLISVSIAFASPVFAAQAVQHPCKKIEVACQSAGYLKRHHKDGKGFWKDCMQPILAGQTVTGVTVDAADIQSCQERRAKSKKK